jgi:hypothetical protein
MELNQQFREFLTAIRPTPTQKEEWRSGSALLRSRLDQDEDLGDIVVATFLQGSVRRSTAIRPLGEKRADVDIVVVTNIDHTTVAPDDAMSVFVPFLERHYHGKWDWQGRSFGIVMSHIDIDLVITALPNEPTARSAMERLYKSQAVETAETLEDDLGWRLNEDWRPRLGDVLAKASTASDLDDAPDNEWRPHPLFLPDREDGRWGRTHPLAQIQWTAEKNRDCNGHYVNLVRAMKWWRQTHASDLPKYPKGYPLEHMIGTVLDDRTPSMARGLVDVLEGMRDTWAALAAKPEVPELCDHGVPEHDVLKRLDVRDFVAFHAAVSVAAEKARAALDCSDAQESGERWQELLGKKFPLPGPQGGDRGGGFSKPAAAADPRPTKRFA